ncbi:MAG TPA: TonB-dependent receptor [archaeon]|nr:TonB-dependent receptor [archaeon]
MHQKSSKRYLSFAMTMVLLLIFTAPGLFAQLSTGKVEGIVRDKDSGQPLAGAQVTIEGTRLGNVTNNDGYYFILNVPPGRRDIAFTYTGYQKTTVSNQLILAGQTLTIDAGLSSTVVQLEGITVEGESEILLPRDQTVSKQRLTAERIEEMPAQKLEDMMVLEAGVQTGGRGAMERGLRIRGGRLGEEAMVVDGVMVRNYTADPFRQGQGWIFDGEIGSRSEDTTPLEFSTTAVEEVDIITGGFQAEYGNAQSGIINIVTKEGGPQLKGSVRYTTDQVMPRTADWGYNQLMTSIGGPVVVVPNMYFHLSAEIQGEADRSYTHADEGFRAVDQTFVDRLNNAVRNDPVVKLRGELPFSLEKFEIGREFYASKTGQNKSLFSAPNPVRLPGNWGDRTLGSGKLTYSPLEGLKFIGSLNRSRNQYSYPAGWDSEGNYFQTGLFYKGDPDWDHRVWGSDTVVHVYQAYARKVRTTNSLLGVDWDIFRTANRSASLQFRYTSVHSVENNNSSLENDWERSTFMSWSPHDVRFEIEKFPNREGRDVSWWPDGALGWKMNALMETPFSNSYYTAYYLNYFYLQERQNNYKADIDFQINRYNRAKLGFQLADFSNISYRVHYQTLERNELNEFRYRPQLWGAYIQNRTDLGDFVLDYGLRYDGYAPRCNWGLTALNRYGDNIIPTVHTELSPRFDVAFPVTDKSQLRFSYGVFTQLPSFSYMLSRSNPGGLEYSRTDAFEAGLSYLISNDMVLDMVAYYRDVDGNVAEKEYFQDHYYWYTDERDRFWTYGLTNRDNGNIKGVDLTMRKRFSENFAFNMMYTLQFSRTTGSAYNSPDLRTDPESDYDPTTGERYVPPDELRPIDGDRTHKFTCQFNYLFPQDFQTGTLQGKILKNFRTYAVFSLQSGEPLLYLGLWGNYKWTRADNTSMTLDPSGRMVGGLNFFRGRWFVNLDLRMSKQFSLGKARKLSIFSEIFNVTNRKNHVSYPSGVRIEPYTHVTGGVDLVWDQLPPGDFNLPRFNADFNADGVLTVEEAALGDIARSVMETTMDKRQWGMARRVRFGLDFSF